MEVQLAYDRMSTPVTFSTSHKKTTLVLRYYLRSTDSYFPILIMTEQLNMLSIWLDSTGADYSLRYEVSNNKAPLCTVAVYKDYWKTFTAKDHATLVVMVQDITQFLKLR